MTRNIFENTNKMTLKSILHFIFLGAIYTGCTTTYIDTTNTLTHRPIQDSSSALPCWFVLCTLCCNYHAAVTGSKSFATNLLMSFKQKVAKR